MADFIKSFKLQRKPEDRSLANRFPFWIGTLAGSLFIGIVFLVAFAEIQGEVKRHNSLLDFMEQQPAANKKMMKGNGSSIVFAPKLGLMSPVPGSTVSGVVPVKLSVGRLDAMVKVFVDGNETGLMAAPHMFDWNTLNVANGSHVLKFVLADDKGNEASVSAQVTVQN